MEKFTRILIFGFIMAFIVLPGFSQEKVKKEKKGEGEEIKRDSVMNADLVGGLVWRGIGPAYTSGRIADFAVNPENHSEWYVAVASGNIWKTTNNGTTFSPVFDQYGAYAIGCLALDPNNPHIIWAGTGENNHQRALGYGDGAYKSMDGGETWKNMGLKDSRQIGAILVDPRNSNVLYVAAEGSAWGPGGDRGLYKTTDGGQTWNKILEISQHTGVNNVIMDPRNPDVLYATSEQRRRHVHTKIGGGPESAVYKSTDGGQAWEKIMTGLPSCDIGGMGIAISPVNPDILYLIVEAAGDAGGFFRSTNRGASWEKRSDHSASGQYYNEIYCDPKDVDKVYSMETISQVTIDGGKTWQHVSTNKRHVDDHALWIDPDDTDHFLIGGDGGIYETFDGGSEYLFKSNLPVTQFYRVQVDQSLPFYYVYGGTQDNSSMGGPSRSINREGVLSDDWFVTNGGDGFWSQIDPTDPSIVYAEAQYGYMVRYDRQSKEAIDIRPEPKKGEDSYKWNWNTPLIISPHSHTRLYCAANKVFRSDDRGNTWAVISDDLTAQLDRNTWPVMDKFWSSDAVAKDVSTSLYGEIVSLDESPIKEDLLYAGTDDGLIQVTEDAGQHWTKIEAFPGVPAHTYVSDLLASAFDENVVYASFDNILRDDFKPYLMKSTDKGKTWRSISGNLPENHTVHTIQEDFILPGLLFVGTEFGVFFTLDGGENWIQLKAGMPTIAIKDMAIQRRENDLVTASFGRGFFILDDYSPLRKLTKEILDSAGFIFPVKDALMYQQTRGKYGQGSTVYVAKNPDFGALFTYYIKEVPKTKKQTRKEQEKALFKNGDPIPQLGEEERHEEELEIAPYLTLTIADADGRPVRTLRESAKKGIHRTSWDLRYQSTRPVQESTTYTPTKDNGSDVMAMPGIYSVTLALTARGATSLLAGPVSFAVVPLENTTIPATNRSELVAYHQEVAALSRVMRGTEAYAEGLQKRVIALLHALHNTPTASDALILEGQALKRELDEILHVKFNRETSKPSAEENPPAPVPLNDRLNKIAWSSWGTSGDPTGTQREALSILKDEFPLVYQQVKEIGEVTLPALEAKAEAIGAPVTPGRLPEFP